VDRARVERLLGASAGGKREVQMNVLERYQRDVDAARRRIAALDWRSVKTSFGRVEYLDRGDGPVVLVIHGITQGADGGLRDLAEELVPEGYPALVLAVRLPRVGDVRGRDARGLPAGR
jgi:hypothetical protein